MRRPALRDLTVHHGPDVVPHRPHGDEQRAQLVPSAAGKFAVQITPGDPPSHCGGGRDRADNPLREQPGDDCGKRERGAGADQADHPIPRYRFACVLAVGESVSGNVIDQQVDLLTDDLCMLIESIPGRDTGLRVSQQAASLVVPRGSSVLHRQRCLGGPGGLRSFGSDRQVLVHRLGKELDTFVERRLRLRIGMQDPSACQGRFHAGEIGGGGACEIDRHQRFIEGFANQNAGLVDPHCRREAKRARDCAHNQEGDKDLHTDRRRTGGDSGQKNVQTGPW